VPTNNLTLQPLEHQYLKARTRYVLGLRTTSPFGSNYVTIPPARRREIERAVDDMLRPG
jgi:hypothetical protein